MFIETIKAEEREKEDAETGRNRGPCETFQGKDFPISRPSTTSEGGSGKELLQRSKSKSECLTLMDMISGLLSQKCRPCAGPGERHWWHSSGSIRPVSGHILEGISCRAGT